MRSSSERSLGAFRMSGSRKVDRDFGFGKPKTGMDGSKSEMI